MAIVRLFALSAGLLGLIQGVPLPGKYPNGAQCLVGQSDIKIAWLNTQGARRTDLIEEWIAREQPDIFGVAELPPSARAFEARLARNYPYRQNCQERSYCSTEVFARDAPVSGVALARGDAENRKTLSGAAMKFRQQSNSNVWHLVALHLSRPTTPAAQSRELHEFEARLGADANTIVIGDFNLTPRMPLLTDFAARNELRVTLAGRPTWPASSTGPLQGGLWQIDQILVGRNWSVRTLHVSPWVGSDHRGFSATLCRTQ
ncbi:endonuclease/exonuclease/phosphatase family protein [Novosphingobium profundi]|uniref:endonuclease/exonuclease/phosphatase family protein n=1 Tax=Novosphingobium profundi TaxID=1774954 RepID=UPI001BDAFF1E|nr:endonuclease/exonuclease/phosphatase family protein [Novosphingobium profundi]MBT0667172.1 endonuclease/exonuclease/phosphatase family protein [Novosphingobium profundi]